MGKIAWMFSGQGAQYTGMGKSLSECSCAARAVFDMAETLRPGTFQQCISADKETLSITRNTQPCLFCVDLAAACALAEKGGKADFLAGFSLGEIPALAFGGYLSYKDAFSFVCRRAQEMDRLRPNASWRYVCSGKAFSGKSAGALPSVFQMLACKL